MNETQKVGFREHHSHARFYLQNAPKMHIFIQTCSKYGVSGSESNAKFFSKISSCAHKEWKLVIQLFPEKPEFIICVPEGVAKNYIQY